MKQIKTRTMQTNEVLSELLNIANGNIERDGDISLMSNIIEAMQIVEQNSGELFVPKEETRVYLVDDRQVDYQEVVASPRKWTDEKFIEFAENEGSVYSLDGFQNQWNNRIPKGEFFNLDLEQTWIRIIKTKNGEIKK